jgi:hypothetical protein
MPADPGFTTRQDQVRAATARCGGPGLPVGCGTAADLRARGP